MSWVTPTQLHVYKADMVAKTHNAAGHKEWVLITVNSAKHLNQTIEDVP